MLKLKNIRLGVSENYLCKIHKFSVHKNYSKIISLFTERKITAKDPQSSK